MMMLMPALVWTLVVLRWLLFRHTFVDRQVNIAVTAESVAGTVWLPMVAQRISETVATQIGIMAVVLACTALARLGAAWRGGRSRALPIYLVCAASMVVMILFAIPSERHGVPVYRFADWTGVVYALAADLVPTWGGVAAFRAAEWGIRHRSEPREAVVYVPLLALSVFHLGFCVVIPVAAVLVAAGERDVVTAIYGSLPVVLPYAAVVWAALLSVPTGVVAFRRLGWDRMSRRYRLLSPLWSDLTAACPEVVHHVPVPPEVADGIVYRLHRRIIEISDAILILSRYAEHPRSPDTAVPGHARAGRRERMLASAVALSRAAHAKSAGPPAFGKQTVPGGLGHSALAADRELFALARIWPRAAALARAGATTTV